jgi:hypothetical protein
MTTTRTVSRERTRGLLPALGGLVAVLALAGCPLFVGPFGLDMTAVPDGVTSDTDKCYRRPGTGCTDPLLPWCDKDTGKCVACLPSLLGSCPVASICILDGGLPHCTSGCARSSECLLLGQDAVCCGGHCQQSGGSTAGCPCVTTADCEAGTGRADCCGGFCRDLDRDISHCGTCGQACTPGQICSRGVCN